MGGMSQIKTEHFSLPWHLHLPPHPSYILFFVAKRHPLLGTQLISTQKGGSPA